MTNKVLSLAFLAILAVIFLQLLGGYVPDEGLNQSAAYYATRTAPDLGAQNVVTGIIVTYRGLDTLGEVTVLFLTAAIVALVLVHGRAREIVPGPRPFPAGELLQTGSRLLAPLILLLGVYVFVNGHLSPGGGFQGGAIVASAMLLLLLTDPMRRFSHALIARIEATAGLLFVVLGLLGLAFAGGFLDARFLPAGWFGALFSAGAIPLIYVLVGLKVGAEFSSMLLSLAETEDRK